MKNKIVAITILATGLLFVQSSFCEEPVVEEEVIVAEEPVAEEKFVNKKKGITYFINNSDVEVWIKQAINGGADYKPEAGKRVKPGEKVQWETKGSSQGIRVYSGKNYENGLDHYIFCEHPTMTACEGRFIGDDAKNDIQWTLIGNKNEKDSIENRGSSGCCGCAKTGRSNYILLLDEETDDRIKSRSDYPSEDC